MTDSESTTSFTSIPVLTYHDINHAFRAGITRVIPEKFRAHMQWLSDNGYTSVHVSDIPALADSTGKFFSITFDDAYSDLDDAARPILNKHGYKTTLVIIVGYVGRANRWEARLGGPSLHHMDWSQIKDWMQDGHQIASHGYNHRCLIRLNPDELEHEICDSKTELENRLGVEVQVFVPPFGRINQTVMQTAANAGYKIVCLNTPVPVHHEVLSVIVRRGINRFDSIKSFQRKIQHGWQSKTNATAWKFIHVCSGGTIVAQRLSGKKNIT